jgi:predicted nucleic acid-binding protein
VNELILVDTSVWVDHLRASDPRLSKLLTGNRVLVHPLVIGELACGYICNRSEVLTELGKIPSALVADHDEVLQFLNERDLWGKGLGWIDVNLLASALLTGCPLWSIDRALAAAAATLGASYVTRE